MRQHGLMRLIVIIGISILLVFSFQTTAFAGTKPTAVKKAMDECAKALRKLKQKTKGFLAHADKIRARIAKPVDDQAELSKKDWQNYITNPRSKTWREEKNEVKNAISNYQKKCKGITKKIKTMDKPPE